MRPPGPAPVLLLCAACAAPAAAPGAPERPDARALARETLVQARRVRVVAAARWRDGARLEGIRVEEPEPGTRVARGGAVLVLGSLRVEADEIRVRWLPDPEHRDFLLYAEEVARFRQRRDQPYSSENLGALTMANDQVSFFPR